MNFMDWRALAASSLATAIATGFLVLAGCSLSPQTESDEVTVRFEMQPYAKSAFDQAYFTSTGSWSYTGPITGPSYTTPYGFTIPIPSNASQFSCYGLNVMAEDIASTMPNVPSGPSRMSAILAGDYCSYPGVTSNLFSASSGVVELKVPSGKSRVIQVLGIVPKPGSGCPSGKLETAVSPPNEVAAVFEVGRTTSDLFRDTEVAITSSYDPSNPKEVSCQPKYVASPLTLSPSFLELASGGSSQINASGGYPPYTFTLTPGPLTSTTAQPSVMNTFQSGVEYKAASASTIDYVRVTDSKGVSAEAKIIVKAPLLDPMSIPGLVVWLKPQAIGVTPGSALSTWPDSTSQSNSPTAGTAPNFNTSTGSGLNSSGTTGIVNFNGSTQTLTKSTTTGLTNTVGWTIFALARYNNTGNRHIVTLGTANAATSTALVFDGTNNKLTFGDNTYMSANPNNSLSPNTWYVAVGKFTGTSSLYGEAWSFGTNPNPLHVSTATLTANTTASNPRLGIGTDATSSQFFSGDIAEVLIYDHPLNTTDLLRVAEYLQRKYLLPQN